MFIKLNGFVLLDLLNFTFAVSSVHEEPGKDEPDPDPLPRNQAVPEEENRGENSEELPCCCH